MYRRSFRSIGRRQLSSTCFKLNEVKVKLPETIPVQPKKKSHPFRTFFIRIGLLTSVVYLGGIALSLKNDAIYDNFVDYFPLGEELIEFTENYLLNYNYGSSKNSADSDVHAFNSIIDKTVPVTKTGILSTTITEEELKKLDEGKEQVKVNSIDTSQPSSAVEFKLPLVEFKTNDETLNKTVDALNDVIQSINKKAPVHASVILKISDSIKELSSKLGEVSSDYTKSLGNLLNGKSDQLELITQEKEVELTKNFIKQLDLEREALERKYHENLINEIEATKSKIFLQADNKIDAVKLSQLNEFNRIISDKIDNERNGKLSKLDDIFTKIDRLEQFEIEISKNATSYLILKNLNIEIAKLNATLNQSTKPVILNDQFNNLSQLVSSLNDDLLAETLNQLPKSGNLLTKQQLITRWKLLVPELKSASLLPPNAGILGHFTSKILSKFLFSKEGFAEGNDIESIVARVNGFLERDELDLAVEQVANLKGWSRKLADDWVKESRKRLEVEFLIDLIEYETRLLA